MRIALVVDEVLDKYKKKMIKAIQESLDGIYENEVVPFNEDFMRKIKEYDLAMNIATGGGKEARQLHVASVLDLMGIPYTGSPPLTHAFCIDKSVTKAIVKQYGIDTPKFIVVRPGESVPEDHGLRYPLLVKLVRQGSSKGLRKESVANNYNELLESVKWVHEKFNEPALIEEYIDGMELTIAFVEDENGINILPPMEIDFSRLPDGIEKFFSDRVKNSGEFDEYIDYYVPARLDNEELEKVRKVSKRTFEVLGFRGYGRIDMRIKDGKYHILEVNSLPMLVPDYSNIPLIFEKTGKTYKDMILSIVNAAKRRFGI